MQACGLRELIIGSRGFIGANLKALLPDAETAGHRRGHDHFLDLVAVDHVPPCDVAYLCAGVNGAWKCEASQQSFAVNVDGPIDVARHVTAAGGFLVAISSMSVEWTGGTKYQQQKTMAETVLRTMPGVGVVRAGRVTQENVAALCRELIRVGRNRVSGVTRWGSNVPEGEG